MYFSLKNYLKEKKEIIDKRLIELLSLTSKDSPSILYESMRYSLEAGGKRLRPILVYATCEALDGNLEDALIIGCAIEFIHTYSLIHDDLPAMDDDDYRRGKLTNHKVFGEGIAILAGDALLTEAFNLLTNYTLYKSLSSEKLLKIANYISESVGSTGMVAGQVLDLEFENKPASLSDVEKIHLNKTAKLITASCLSGAIIGSDDKSIWEKIEKFGKLIGLSFQIIDDILDIVGDDKLLGKKTGVDIEKGKATYPSIIGIEKSRKKAFDLINSAKEEIKFLKDKGIVLQQIAEYFIKRLK